MTSEYDLIRREDALTAIRKEMKNTYTAARKQGYKRTIDLLKTIPTVQPPELKHSHWFVASGWWLCDNCGGRSGEGRCTPHCPWCGARMDELLDKEIE